MDLIGALFTSLMIKHFWITNNICSACLRYVKPENWVPTQPTSLILFWVYTTAGKRQNVWLMLFQLLTDVNVCLRLKKEKMSHDTFVVIVTYVNAQAYWELLSHSILFYLINGTQTLTHIVWVRNKLLSTQVNEAFSFVFHLMSTSDQPAVIEPNKLNLRGSDASLSLSVWISLSLMRSGSRPVPVVSVEVKKVGTVHSKANLTNLTARLSAPTTVDLEAAWHV